MSFYRIQQADRDATELLDPATWESRQWFGEIYTNCPACGGCGCDDCDHGQIEDVRHGVSTCGSVEDLITYLRTVGCDLTDTVLVELDGTYAADDDHDKHLGAVLIHPTKILSVIPVSDELADAIYA